MGTCCCLHICLVIWWTTLGKSISLKVWTSDSTRVGWSRGCVPSNSGMTVFLVGLSVSSLWISLLNYPPLLVSQPALSLYWLLVDCSAVFDNALGYKLLHSVIQLNLGPFAGVVFRWVFVASCGPTGAVSYFFLVNCLPYDLLYCSHEATSFVLIVWHQNLYCFWDYR